MALKPDSELWKYFNNFVEEGMAECKLCKQRLRSNRSYNLKLHIKKIHTNRNEIKKYFNIDAIENIAECITCHHRLKNRLCNLRLHMRRSHGIIVHLPEDDKQRTIKTPSPLPYDEDRITAVLRVAKRKMMERECNGEKRPRGLLYIKMQKKTIIRAVIGLIVEDGLAPHLFVSKHFKAILQPMCEAISDKECTEFKVDENEIERIINLLANFVRNDFSNDLHWRLLCVKIYTDLNASPKTFCVSTRFIQDGEIQTRFLGIIDLKDEDCELKEEHIKPILYKFNIDSNQIIAVFWDNSKQKYYQQVKNSEYLKEVEQFESYPEIKLGDIKVERYLGVSAQLCMLDIFKHSSILQTFLECRNLIKFLNNKSNGYRELFDQHKLNIPQLDSPWQWGSTYKMMQDLYDAREVLKNIKFEKLEDGDDEVNSNDQLWSFIEAFCKSTAYLQKSILKFYEEELHIGDFYAQWLKCKLLTQKLVKADETDDFTVLILTEVIKAIEKRSKELLSQDRFAACIFLDPRFQRTLNIEQKANAIEYLKKLWSRAKLYIADELESMETTEQMFDDDEDEFLNEFLSHDIQTKTNSVHQKIEDLKLPFQLADANILSFWKGQKVDNPEMHTMSSICFALPATEIYNKICYANIYRSDVKSNLSTYTEENLLNVRLNSHLLDNAFTHLQLFNCDQSYSSTLSEKDVECYDISDDCDDDSNTTSTLVASCNNEIASTSFAISP